MKHQIKAAYQSLKIIVNCTNIGSDAAAFVKLGMSELEENATDAQNTQATIGIWMHAFATPDSTLLVNLSRDFLMPPKIQEVPSLLTLPIFILPLDPQPDQILKHPPF